MSVLLTPDVNKRLVGRTRRSGSLSESRGDCHRVGQTVIESGRLS